MEELHMKRKYKEEIVDGAFSGDKYCKWTNMGDPPPDGTGTMYNVGQNSLPMVQNGMMAGYPAPKQENQCNTNGAPVNAYHYGYSPSPPVPYSSQQMYSNNGLVHPPQSLSREDQHFQYQQHYNPTEGAGQYNYNQVQNQVVPQQNSSWAPSGHISSANMEFRSSVSTMHQMSPDGRRENALIYNAGMQESQQNSAMSYSSMYLPTNAPGYTQIKQEQPSQPNGYYQGVSRMTPSMSYYGNTQQELEQRNLMANSPVPATYQVDSFPGSWGAQPKINSQQQGNVLFSGNLNAHNSMPNSMVSAGQYSQVYQSNNPQENNISFKNEPFMNLLQSNNYGSQPEIRGTEPQYNCGQNSNVSLQNCSQMPANNTSERFLGGVKQEFSTQSPLWAADGPMPKCIPDTNLSIEMNSRKIPYYNHATINIAEEFLKIELDLCRTLCQIPVGEPVTHIYNPLEYAYEPHSNFVQKYCTSTRPVLFLGMNPGPFGMVQNGIPFGEVSMVKNWLKISGTVYKPQVEHPQRLIKGMECTRSEVSGARFWGFLAKVCKEPEVFFQNCYIHNLCPLAYMSKTGKNITPPQLKVAVRKSVSQACATAFCRVVRLLDAKIIIGIGRYAQQSAQTALQDHGIEGIRVESIMHPSPINPAANKGWEDIVAKQLEEMGLMQYLTGRNPTS